MTYEAVRQLCESRYRQTIGFDAIFGATQKLRYVLTHSLTSALLQNKKFGTARVDPRILDYSLNSALLPLFCRLDFATDCSALGNQSATVASFEMSLSALH